MGTVELTGLEIIATQALGQLFAIASHSAFTMPAAQGSRRVSSSAALFSARQQARVLGDIARPCGNCCPSSSSSSSVPTKTLLTPYPAMYDGQQRCSQPCRQPLLPALHNK